MKNSYLIIICLFLFIGHKAGGETVSHKVHFSHLQLKMDSIKGEDGEVYIKMSYPDTEVGNTSGFPTLPIKYITIPIPYAADNVSLSIQCSNTTSHTLNRRLFPIQEPEATSIRKKEKEFRPCESGIYESNVPYPSKRAEIAEISCAGHGDRNVVVAVYPVTYHPIENRYDFYEEITITLSFSISQQRTQALARSAQTTDIGIPFYEYCVITSQNLKKAFTRLVAWEREKGLNAGVVCIEDILNNSYIVGDTVSSIYDDAGKIRQYLQYAYNSGVTKYVLFGGNYQVLPIRYGTGYNYTPVPSDLYFSELNSDWNKDGDQYYGEAYYNFDYGSELYVGRILCTNSEEIQNWTDKVLRYELNPGNGNFSYLRKALYTQADQMQFHGEAEYVESYLHDIFPIDTIISENPSYSDYYPTSPYGNDVIAEMNNHYGYVSWGGHGAPTSITVKSGGIAGNPKYAITSIQADTIPWITSESANGLDNLTNKSYPMFAYSIACTITPFDTIAEHAEYPNIGQSFTLGKDYGGPALIGNTRDGWTGSTRLSVGLQKLFNDSMRNYTIGKAEVLSKQYYTNGYKHHLSLSSNVIGCPNLRVWTDIPTRFYATLSYTPNGYSVTANSSIIDSEIGIRNITQTNEEINRISFNPSQGATMLTNAENCLITLSGRNSLPQIMPLTIQDIILHGTHHAIVKNVTCGRDVREGSQGNVVFDEDSDYTFETKGTFVLKNGVEIKKGAKLEVIPSEINY